MTDYCKFQKESSEGGLFYCRNGNVKSHNNLVNLSICKNCPHRSGDPVKIRPDLSKEEIDMLVAAAKEKRQSPGLLEQAKTAAQAVSDTISGVLAGRPILATQAEADRRWNICEPCEFRNNNTCTLCGCGLKAKTKIDSQECPAGKWAKQEDPPNELPGKPKWADGE